MIITLDEAKTFLRVDITAEDTMIQTLIDAATSYLNSASGIVFDSTYPRAKTVCLMLVAEWYSNRENAQQLRVDPNSVLNGLITQLAYATSISPPQVPTGLTGIAETDYIRLRWNANIDPNVDGYNVYRDGVKLNQQLVRRRHVQEQDYWIWEFEFVPIPPETPPGVLEFRDSTITSGTSYNYQVSAVDTLGNESTLSGSVTVVAT